MSHGSHCGEYADAAPGDDGVSPGFHKDGEAYSEVVLAGLLCAHVS